MQCTWTVGEDLYHNVSIQLLILTSTFLATCFVWYKLVNEMVANYGKRRATSMWWVYEQILEQVSASFRQSIIGNSPWKS